MELVLNDDTTLSLGLRPSSPPVFDHLQYATWREKAWENWIMCVTSGRHGGQCTLKPFNTACFQNTGDSLTQKM